MENAKLESIFGEMRARIEALGYDCAGVELAAENGMNFLRAYAELPGGIDLDDCEKISEALNEYLDSAAEDLPDGYFLEVSSPGLERPLFTPDDYRRFSGSEANISFKNGKSRRGLIVGVSDDGESVTVNCGDGEQSVKLSAIKRARLVYNEEKGQKKTFKKLPKKKKQH